MWVKDGIKEEMKAIDYFRGLAETYGMYQTLGQRYNALMRDLNGGVAIQNFG